VKKQARPLQLIIEDEVEKIANNPAIGEEKKGDIAGYRVHKFHLKGIQLLIAYLVQKEEIIFFRIGPRENFYRELKRYLRETK
jgi:plasmid stabilization system protein ParE